MRNWLLFQHKISARADCVHDFAQRPRRILFVSDATFMSGAERSLLITVLALRALGVEVYMTTPKSSPLRQNCMAHHIPWLCYQFPALHRLSKHFSRWAAFRLAKLIEKYNIDLVHVNQAWCYPSAGLAARLAGVPVVCHLRDLANEDALRWYLAPPPTGIVSISNYIRSLLVKNNTFPQVPVIVMHNPVTLPADDILAQRSHIRRKLCFALNVPLKHKLVLFAGQLTPQKGLAILASALSRLKSYPIHAIVVGIRNADHTRFDRGTRRQLVRLSASQRLAFLPSQKEMTQYYLASDLVIVPSLEEPLGRVALEAASYGVPSIVSDVDGLPEAVISGVTGWRIPAGDPCALAQTILNACESPLSLLGQAARQFVRRHHAPEIYARKLYAFYDYLYCSCKHHTPNKFRFATPPHAQKYSFTY